MRLAPGLIMLMLLVSLLSGCARQRENNVVQIQMDQTTFPILVWNMEHSHITTIHGRVLVNNKPVIHASVQMSGKRIVETDDSGTFNLLLDRSSIARIPLRIQSLQKATLAGKSINKSIQQQLLSASNEINVIYPIRILQVSASLLHPDEVEIRGRAVVQDKGVFPAFQQDKYGIYGTIMDHNHKPVEKATVTIRREGVEGFAKSKPSDNKGNYLLVYTPQEDEELNLHVFTGSEEYHLPENKVILFPEGTSVKTNITLPEGGSVIADYPPYLVSTSAPGALYSGLLIGLSVDNNVKYHTTVPDKTGSFTITVSKRVWDQHPDFFETNASKFLRKTISVNENLSSTFIEKPKSFEPSRIKPI